jgi:hypothetical protein
VNATADSLPSVEAVSPPPATVVNSDAAPSEATRIEARRGNPAFSMRIMTYSIGPLALVILLVLREFHAVADAPVWAYLAALGGAVVSSRVVERWADCKPGSLGLHIRVMTHAASVTAVIYLSGWGPELGMAYTFAAFADLEQSGARTWRA